MQTASPPRTDPPAGATKVRPWITCVVPAYNEGEGIRTFLQALCAHLAGLTDRYDVIVVDDGSRDCTGVVVVEISEFLPVSLIGLSRNFGKEAAISAGLEDASGDAVVIIDADFQHPLATIDDFIRCWQEGYEMVYGIRTDRRTDPPLRRYLSRLFYQILSRGASVEIPPDAGDFRLLDRKVVNALRQLPESSRFMKGLYNWVGFRSIGVPFVVDERRDGTTTFNFRRLLELAITGMTSFTAFPLRLWTGVGLFFSICSIFYAIYIAVRTFFQGIDVPGWATLAVAVMFLGGVQLFSIGILGEYVSRIFTEVKRRPNYLVARRHDYRKRDES